jgi:hypothetical protein
MAYVPEDFTKPSPPIATIMSREMWCQETGPRAFEVGISRRSWWRCLLALAIFLIYAISQDEFYGVYVRSHHNSYVLVRFLQWIATLVIFPAMAAMEIWGKTTVTVNGGVGIVFTGIGPIGWRRRFRWRYVSDIVQTSRIGNYINVPQISIFANERIDFAAGVKASRRKFMLAVLCQKWREPGH